MKRKPFNAIGCYIFAGGFTLGVRKHFNVLAHFEDGPYGTETAAFNIPELRGNIFTAPDAWPAEDYAGRVDFIYGNPPCAPWSVCAAGRKIPWRLDPRTKCAKNLFRLVERIQPKVWAWESVRPAFTKGREMVDHFVLQAREMGYHATVLMVEGTRHGVPQKRPRFFLVLSTVEMQWEPTRTKGIPTVGAEFARAPFPSETSTTYMKFYLDLVKQCPQGVRLTKVFNEKYPERVRDAERKGTKVLGRPSFQILRLDEKAPSCTLTGGPMQIHPRLDRCTSVEESASLCGYPRDFVFKGNIGKQYAQVAQAVMPPVGEYLARIAAKSIKAGVKITTPAYERVEIFNESVERQPLTATALTEQLHKETETMAKTTEPLACPTCNGKAVRARIVSDCGQELTDHYFLCFASGCNTRGPALPTAEKALAAWNKIPRKANGAAPEAKPVNAAPSKGKLLLGQSQRQPAKPAKPAKQSKAAVLEALAGGKKSAKQQNEVISATVAEHAEGAKRQRGGCGKRIRELLLKKIPDEKILEMVHKEFPWTKAKQSDVNWNKRKLASQGGVA